jgi:hypothetical protein
MVAVASICLRFFIEVEVGVGTFLLTLTPTPPKIPSDSDSTALVFTLKPLPGLDRKKRKDGIPKGRNFYRISQTNDMHTLLYTKMFKLHSYMFRTVNWFIFRDSHNFTHHTYIHGCDHKSC